MSERLHSRLSITPMIYEQTGCMHLNLELTWRLSGAIHSLPCIFMAHIGAVLYLPLRMYTEIWILSFPAFSGILYFINIFPGPRQTQHIRKQHVDFVYLVNTDSVNNTKSVKEINISELTPWFRTPVFETITDIKVSSLPDHYCITIVFISRVINYFWDWYYW